MKALTVNTPALETLQALAIANPVAAYALAVFALAWVCYKLVDYI